MNLLDEQIEVITAMLRAQGAKIHIDPAAPEYVKRAWLQLLLDCPDCRTFLHLPSKTTDN